MADNRALDSMYLIGSDDVSAAGARGSVTTIFPDQGLHGARRR